MRQNKTYEMAMAFLRKYPMTIVWRIWEHSKVVDQFVGTDEELVYVFVAQENDNPFDVISSCVIALTDKRIIIGRKRLLWGYFYHSITPDMFNDLEVRMGLIWGRISIETIKEKIYLSNIDRHSLVEIEEQIIGHITELKKQYGVKNGITK